MRPAFILALFMIAFAIATPFEVFEKENWFPDGGRYFNPLALPEEAQISIIRDGRANDDDCAMILVDNFMTEEEVEKMKTYIRSKVSDDKTYRFGYGSENDQIVKNIEKRIEILTGLPAHESETPVQLTIEEAISNNVNFHHDSAYGKSARSVTVLLYLSDVKKGGETIFPAVGNKKGAKAFVKHMENGVLNHASKLYKHWKRKCLDDKTLKVKPKAGRAVIFWHNHLNGKMDPQMVHAACPVLEGKKFALQKFKEQHFQEKAKKSEL